jgi:hypothetical protein
MCSRRNSPLSLGTPAVRGTSRIAMSMTSEEILSRALMAVEANENFTEAVMRFHDNSRLCFCHRVGERWAKAVDSGQQEGEAGLAGELLRAMTKFRLNAKHLDIQFEDGSRWDEALQVFNRDG